MENTPDMTSKSNPAPAQLVDEAVADTPESGTATPADTRKDLLSNAGAGYTVIRHHFCQRDVDGVSNPGVLGALVRARKKRALQLYLLLITAWPFLEKRDQPLAAAVWARALTTANGRKWSVTNVSDTWRDLESLGLVERRRLARGVVVTPMREDCAGIYVRPVGAKKDRGESYFTLPGEFWTKEYFERLSLPALAMLLVVASKTSVDEEVWLTNEYAGKWFGLSPRSVEAGLAELVAEGLVEDRVEWVKAPLSAIGATKRHNYSLTGPFSTKARSVMKAKAKSEYDARVGKSAKKTVKKAAKKTPKRSAKKTGAKASAAPAGT